MTSDRRWLAPLALLIALCAGCEDSGAKKSDAPTEQPSPQPKQKAPPPGPVKME